MDLSDNAELLWLSALIADTGQAAPQANALLVGAMARDLLLHYGNGVPISRATEDVDFAFAVPDWDEFAALRNGLLQSGHFTAGRPENRRLVHRSGVPVDLIPFGGVERPDGSIVWPEDETIMSVLGYREARASATEIVLPQTQRTWTVCLSMLVVLKLLAWSERHVYARRRDSSDLFLVLENYLHNGNADRFYEEASAPLEQEDFDYEVAGAWLAGRDARQQVHRRSDQPERIINAVKRILVDEVDPEGPLRLAGEAGAQAEHCRALLAGYYEGFRSE